MGCDLRLLNLLRIGGGALAENVPGEFVDGFSAYFNGSSDVSLGTGVIAPAANQNFVLFGWIKGSFNMGGAAATPPYAGIQWLFRPGWYSIFQLIGSWSANALDLRWDTTAYSPANWNHFCLVYAPASSPKASLYVNGVQATVTSEFDTLTSSAFSEPFYFGQSVDQPQSTGTLDEIAYGAGMATAWDSSDVAEVYNGGAPVDLTTIPKYSELQNWWRFEEDFNDSIGTDNGTNNGATFSTDVP